MDQIGRYFGTLLTPPKVISRQNCLPNLSTEGQENATFEAKKANLNLTSGLYSAHAQDGTQDMERN